MKEVQEVVEEAENAAVKKARDLAEMAQYFFSMEASGGILLVIAATLALIVANSPLYAFYDHLLNQVHFHIGFDTLDTKNNFQLNKSLLHWINDGFMALFFFLVGLEIKREVKEGELAYRSRALLPALAAVGGMVVPALVYYYLNMDTPENISGWAIPAATDIAFALGVLSLLGTKAPVRLKILLTAIAVIDDLGAIIVIALFYTSDLAIGSFYYAAAALIGLFILNRRGVSSITPYALLGFILWVAVLKSGVHATLAGVATAFFIPMTCKHDPNHSPCKHLEHALHPWVSFGILPLFAFANAGVPFKGIGLESLQDPLTLGIIGGLVVGKQLGVFTMLWLAVKTKLSPMPSGVTWPQLYAVSVLCGIGFTMSLFIGGLAFAGVDQQASIRLGVLVGSVISATVGFLLLYFLPQKAPDQKS